MVNQPRNKGCAPGKHGAARPRFRGSLDQRCAARWRITLPRTVPRRAIVRLWCKGNDGERGNVRPPDTGGIRPRRPVGPIRRDVQHHAMWPPFAVRPVLEPSLSAHNQRFRAPAVLGDVIRSYGFRPSRPSFAKTAAALPECRHMRGTRSLIRAVSTGFGRRMRASIVRLRAGRMPSRPLDLSIPSDRGLIRRADITHLAPPPRERR